MFGKPVVVGDLVVVERPGMRLLGRGGEVPRARGVRVVVGQDHAAAAGRDDLVAVEAEHGGMAERAAAPARARSSRAIRSRPRRPRDRISRRPPAAAPCRPDARRCGPERSREAAGRSACSPVSPLRRTAYLVQMRIERCRIEPQRIPARIDEMRDRAGMAHRIRGRDECDRGQDALRRLPATPSSSNAA